MKTFGRFLFPAQPDGWGASLFLLAIRVVFGLLLMSHGMQKWIDFDQLSAQFPDPLGIGSAWSLRLAIFGELICSFAFIIGFLYRLALIPMIVTMSVALFVVHGQDPFQVKELALVYWVIFVLMYISGPGRFSVDRYWAVRFATVR